LWSMSTGFRIRPSIQTVESVAFGYRPQRLLLNGESHGGPLAIRALRRLVTADDGLTYQVADLGFRSPSPGLLGEACALRSASRKQ
jgi:hypothetical protein